MALDAGAGEVIAKASLHCRRAVARRLAATLLALALAPASLIAQPPGAAERLGSSGQTTSATLLAPADLVVWNRRIATFRAPFGALVPSERARGAKRRIEELPLDQLDDTIQLLESTSGDLHGLLIASGNTTLFGLLDADVDLSAGQTLESAGEEARRELLEVFAARVEQNRPATILRAIGSAIAAAVVIVAVCWVDLRIRRRVASRLRVLTPSLSQRVVGFDLRPVLFSAGRVALDAIAWAVRIVVVYVALTLVLRQLPYTRPWSEHLGSFLERVLSGLGARVISALPGLLVAIIIFAVARLVIRGVDRLLVGVEQGTVSIKWLDAATAPATRRIARVVIFLFALTLAYPYLPGSDTVAFKGISVLAGAMLTLGSTGLVTQLMSGLVIIYSRALKPGDLVQIGSTMGFVTEVGILSTKLRTPRGEQITIPNAVVIGNQVTNFVEDALLGAKVTIGYNVPWRQVHDLLLAAAERTPGLRPEPKPNVIQRALSDFYVEYEVRAQLERFDERMKTLYTLHANIQDVFHEVGVQIMVPHFESQPEQPVVAPRAASTERLDAGASGSPATRKEGS